MEDVNMSQSAEQTATGNVPPGGQTSLKKQVSADAFRALTMRLNGKAASAPVPPSIPPVNLEPIVETIVEPTLPDVVESVTEVVPETVAEITTEQSLPPVPDVAAQKIPQVDVLPEQFVEPQSEPEARPETVQPDEPIAADVDPVSEPVVEEAPQEVPAKAPPAFAMPSSGTKIILNPTPKPEPVKQHQPSTEIAVTVREAIQPGEMFDEQADTPTTAPAAEPIAVAIDPLQAAMNLVNATGLSDGAGDSESQADIASPQETAPLVPETLLNETLLSETAADAISQTFEVPGTQAPETLVVEKSPEQPKPTASTRPKKAPPVIGDVQKSPPEQEPDAESGETARALLDIMSSGSQPQERALAADTLLQLIPRMMIRDLVALSERVCMMEDAPPLLVKALINHREPRVAGPLLEDAKVINEQDLLRLIATTDVDRLIMMAKHRKVSQTVCDALIARGEPSVYLTLVRNPGARLSHDAFVAFSEIAKSQSSLQAPLATRGDTPPPIAFELFWSLPVELRRYILSRFLTDSTTLDKILKITQSVEGGSASEQKFPPSRKVEELVDLIADGVTDQAAIVMAKLAGTNKDNARRIIADPDGEPLTVVLKAMGQTRAQFSQAIKKCASSSKAMLRGDRDLAELQIMFDLLSFNKARTLLTYWDWAIEKTGPYTRRIM